MFLLMKKNRINEVKNGIKKSIPTRPKATTLSPENFQELPQKGLRAIKQIYRHTTNQILFLSMESRTNNDRKTGGKTQTT
jgi:hypothetical protein